MLYTWFRVLRLMETDAHTRRMNRIALAYARANNHKPSDFKDHLGKFDHIEFEKHEAGDYRTRLEGAEIRIQAVNVDYRKRPEWVILSRPVSPYKVVWDRISNPFPSMTRAKSELFSYMARDGSAVWHWE